MVLARGNRPHRCRRAAGHLWTRRSQGDDYARLYLHISKDGGLYWHNLGGQINRVAEWTRYQFAIPEDYRVANLRLALCTYAQV